MYFDSMYRVIRQGKHEGQIGLQVGIWTNPSFCDIQLLFPNGDLQFIESRDLERLFDEDEPELRQELNSLKASMDGKR